MWNWLRFCPEGEVRHPRCSARKGFLIAEQSWFRPAPCRELLSRQTAPVLQVLPEGGPVRVHSVPGTAKYSAHQMRPQSKSAQISIVSENVPRVSCARGVNPSRLAANAPAAVIVATPTARICDREETDPITSSGDGIAKAPDGARITSPADTNATGVNDLVFDLEFERIIVLSVRSCPVLSPSDKLSSLNFH